VRKRDDGYYKPVGGEVRGRVEVGDRCRRIGNRTREEATGMTGQ